MNFLGRWAICSVLGVLAALGCLTHPVMVYARTAAYVSKLMFGWPEHGNVSASATDAQAEQSLHDGQHDFDWQLGTWKIHMHRLRHPLTGSTSWTDLDGTVTVRKIWDGRANLAEIVADGPSGHLEFLSLRLYDPVARQWTLNFANTKGGTLGVPLYGEFKDGRGEFYDQETYDGRMIMVRFVFSTLSADSTRDEQSFSADGGKTWEVNWVNTQTRVKEEPDKQQ